jgi:hypothetical protein
VFLGHFAEFEKLFLGAPLGTFGAFLVKLAEVIQIVDVIANALRVRAFTARWQPDVTDADSFQLGELLG